MMNRGLLSIAFLLLFLAGCSGVDTQGTIAELRHKKIKIVEEEIVDGLDKAIGGYQKFLEESTDVALIPEAIRRLADLKVEKEYGLITITGSDDTPAIALPAPEPGTMTNSTPGKFAGPAPTEVESANAFERRATDDVPLASSDAHAARDTALDELEKAGALEAIALYRKLLNEYPHYERNDQVLYQMCRAYEELGRIEEAMQIMSRLAQEYPQSRYLDEVQFRRGEYFFTHRQFLDAEDAYADIVDIGVASSFFPLALYKLGWTFYKQELYEEALHRFISLLDYKLSIGHDFDQIEDDQERKRMDDTFRVISLGFSNLGGADAVVDYFDRYGERSYEDNVYANLSEYYFSKRRYSDAVATNRAFLSRNPFHKKSPLFQMRIVEINSAGGFPSLVIEAKKTYAAQYGLAADYWQYFEPAERPEVLAYLQTNLTDLANHYHALYQHPKRKEEKRVNFSEAQHWYGQFLISFPQAKESPTINYQLADLLLENHDFGRAAVEYEKTAYNYPPHEQSSEAGYAAVYAYRQHLTLVTQQEQESVRREVIRTSLVFADIFPEHDRASIVLGAAADDLYALEDFENAVDAAQTLLDKFPGADTDVTRSAWLVVAHSCYELEVFDDAEAAYVNVLKFLPAEDSSRQALVDNLAAAIYRQGEEANSIENFSAAADHFLRVATITPTSKIRPTAEYDAAAALIQLKTWPRAASVLTAFRTNFPKHELQHEVTKKIAFVYRENGQYAKAATEFERVETETDNDDLRRDALLIAAELHEKSANRDQALVVYRRFVDAFPRPLETNVEIRSKIADFLKQQQRENDYLAQLRRIVELDADAGSERTDRTRYLAANAALVITEEDYEKFVAVALIKPFDVNLRKKQNLMKTATQKFTALIEYEIGEITAAATYYLAEIYAHFSKALMESERPEGLSPLESEEYELAIEEQAYPFEQKAIAVHQSNLELIAVGVYNQWVEKSLARLAVFVPARYAKPVEETAIIGSMETFNYFIAGTLPATPTGKMAPALELSSDQRWSQLDGVIAATRTGSQAPFSLTEEDMTAAEPLDEVSQNAETPETVRNPLAEMQDHVPGRPSEPMMPGDKIGAGAESLVPDSSITETGPANEVVSRAEQGDLDGNSSVYTDSDTRLSHEIRSDR